MQTCCRNQYQSVTCGSFCTGNNAFTFSSCI